MLQIQTHLTGELVGSVATQRYTTLQKLLLKCFEVWMKSEFSAVLRSLYTESQFARRTIKTY